MKLTPNRWSIACLSLIILLGLTAGCKGRKAQKAIEEARAAQAQAQENMAPRYTPEIYSQANNLLAQAEQATNAGNHDEAIQLSQEAIARFQQAITTVPQVREKIEGIQRELQGLLDEIAAGIDKAVEEGVVDQATVTALQTDLEALQARRVELQTSIKEEDIQAAIADAQKLKERSEAAKLAHLKPQAEELQKQILSLIDECQRLNANQHFPNELAAIQPSVDELQNAYTAGNWSGVIDSATGIISGLEEIVAKTRQAAAGEYVAQAEAALVSAKALEVQDVPEYATFLGQAETALGQAKQSLQAGQHSEAFAAAEQVNGFLRQARDSLGANVQKFLDAAAAGIEQAQGAEVQKYAASELAAANAAIQSARDALAAGDFLTAYSQAKKAQSIASGLGAAALRGHAQQELGAVLARLNKAREEGAEQYAQPEFGQVAAEVNALKEMANSGQYQQVIDQAPAKLPAVEKLFERLRVGVEEAITQTESRIAQAEEAEAETWAKDTFQKAQNALQSARDLLAKESYRKAADNAEKAAQLAAEAESSAYRLRAEKNLRKADELLSLAERANSPTLSPLEYGRAREMRRKAGELLSAAKDYQVAWKASVEALEMADVALNERVITAQKACDSALEAQARDYDREEIDRALALLNEAKAAQEAQNFDRANQAAKQATELAASAEEFAWRQRSKQLLIELAGTEQQMTLLQASVHVPALARRFSASLAQARVYEIDGKWAECYAAADDARKAAEESWKEMTNQLNQMIEELNTITQTVGNIAMDDWGRAQKSDFVSVIAEVRRLTELHSFVEAYAAADEALADARSLLDRVQRHNLQVRAEALQTQLKEREQTGSAKILASRSKEIQSLIKKLNSPGDKYDYKELMAQADTAAADLAKFPELAQENAMQRTTQANEILQQAEKAGARKYYPDRFEKAVIDLQWLRNEIQAGDCNGIYEHLSRLESVAPDLLEDTSLALAEDEYKERLSVRLKEMKDLMLDFDYIARLDKNVLIAARATETTTDDPTVSDIYRGLQKPLTAKRLLAAAELLEQNVKADNPPKTLNGLKNLAMESFRHFRKAAEGFAAFGETDKFDTGYREEALRGAYSHLEKTLRLNKEINYIIEQKRKDNLWERFDWKLRDFEENASRKFWKGPLN